MASAKRKAPAKKSEGATRGGDTTVAGDATAAIAEGRVRAVIDALLPTVDGGRFPAKRIAEEKIKKQKRREREKN
jgi:starch synthase (maltosyl-transferring)